MPVIRTRIRKSPSSSSAPPEGRQVLHQPPPPGLHPPAERLLEAADVEHRVGGARRGAGDLRGGDRHHLDVAGPEAGDLVGESVPGDRLPVAVVDDAVERAGAPGRVPPAPGTACRSGSRPGRPRLPAAARPRRSCARWWPRSSARRGRRASSCARRAPAAPPAPPPPRRACCGRRPRAARWPRPRGRARRRVRRRRSRSRAGSAARRPAARRRRRAPTARPLTSAARSGSLSQASTLVKAAQLTTSSGRKVSAQ